ncbi:FtsB family cell division protein [Allostreptomyces psammosilenae]|uniref:Cell division protein FtsB n=1 Tax=Allostreptomyces psammosilenae TaxID=1892865 RepID=A0A852ZZB4_9ACTN|nr:septum formation initiator family protein [Allostreptomyces psammosilenae]NYI06034.1 cell division protein FtsB [Allostreptomyces psammosilenae]
MAEPPNWDTLITRSGRRTGARSTGGAKAQARRRGRLTGRAAVLLLVLCSLALAIAYPARQYVAQRDRIAEARAEAARLEQEVAELRREKARWQDPAYVRARAREDLLYVLPGEIGLTVLPDASPGPSAPAEDAGAGDAGDAALGADRPWYENLWDSVDRAD